MKKCGMAVYLIGICICRAEAQYYYYNDSYYSGSFVIEMGCSAGAMNCLTDLGGRKGKGKAFLKDLNFRVTRPSYSLYIAGMYRDAICFRVETTLGRICSYDSLLKHTDPNPTGRYGRNLGFISNITDIQVDAEIHPLFFKQYETGEAPFWSPYIVIGIGFFKFNPKPHRFEEKYYHLQQFNLPLGFGIKYEVSAGINARFELIHRILFTDYLDDVSSRGNSSNNDAYLSAQCKIGWTIRKHIR